LEDLGYNTVNTNSPGKQRPKTAVVASHEESGISIFESPSKLIPKRSFKILKKPVYFNKCLDLKNPAFDSYDDGFN